MKQIAIVAAAATLSASAALATDPTVSVTQAGTQAAVKGPESNFTGSVRVDARFSGTAPARIGGGVVTFEPGAHTAWHTHPLGQTLIVTAGSGFVQAWGEPSHQIRPGDIAWIPPGVKHWHGAGDTTGMSHIAVSESLDGRSVEWMEKVSVEQYGQAVKK